jgi:hypothetical protein
MLRFDVAQKNRIMLWRTTHQPHRRQKTGGTPTTESISRIRPAPFLMAGALSAVDMQDLTGNEGGTFEV